MATRARTISVRLEYVDHDTGHWCNRCRLGTGLRMWVAVIATTGMHLQQRLYCTECASHDITLES